MCRPIQVSYDVKDTRADGIVAACSYDLCLGFARSQRLICGKEPGAQQCALCTQHQRGGEAAPISNSTGCHHHNIVVALAHGVDDRRYEGQSRPCSTVAAGLRALSDDDISPDVDRFQSVRYALDLANQCSARSLDCYGKGFWVAE